MPMALEVSEERMPRLHFHVVPGRARRPLGGAVEHCLRGALVTLMWGGNGTHRQALEGFWSLVFLLAAFGHI